MSVVDATAAGLLEELHTHASEEDRVKIRRHFPHDDPVIGVRMRTTFDIAKAYSMMPLGEVDALFDRPEYEARLSAVCILDFKARARATADDERARLYDLYLARHDRINAWDMVDRAAPHTIGRYLLERPRDPLLCLAQSGNVYERRTAITAPLYWARFGTPAQCADLFAIAALLADDDDAIVSKPVGIALKYGGLLDEAALLAFLDQHAGRLHRATLRYALEKLAPELRAAYQVSR